MADWLQVRSGFVAKWVMKRFSIFRASLESGNADERLRDYSERETTL